MSSNTFPAPLAEGVKQQLQEVGKKEALKKGGEKKGNSKKERSRKRKERRSNKNVERLQY